MGSPRLARLGKFFSVSLIYAGSIVLQLVTVIILARILGPEDFGRYSVYTAIALILVELLALGSGDILIKQVALRPARFPALFGHSLILGAIGLVPSVLILVAAVFAYSLASPQSLVLVALVGAVEIAFGRAGALGEQAFIGHKQAGRANSLRVAINAVRMAAAILVLLAGLQLDFVSWIAIQAVSTAISGVLVLLVTARRLGAPRLSLLPHRIVGGLPFSGTSVVRLTQLQVDRLLIGLVSTAYVTSIYAAASRVIGLGTTPMVTLLRMTYPHFFARGKQGIRAVMPFGLQVLAGLLGVALCTVVFFYFAAPYLPVLLGEEYRDAVGSAQLLAPITFIFAFQYAGGDILSGVGQQMLRFISTVLNLLFIAAGILLFAREGGTTAVILAVLGGNGIGALATWSFVLFLFSKAPMEQAQQPVYLRVND